jgi:peroxiredoxin
MREAQNRRTWLGILAAIIAFCGPPATAEPRVGDTPTITGQTIDGQSFDLHALSGQVVVVNFWATWCAPCRIEMPALDAVNRAHQAEGLTTIGVSLDNPHDRRDVEGAMQGLSYKTLLARQARLTGLQAPGVLPETIVIDRDGVIRAVFQAQHGAPLTQAALDAAVTPLLRRPAQPTHN